MNDNFSHIEKLLERTAGSVSLSRTEKDGGRESLRSFIRQGAPRTRSSWGGVFMHSMRAAFVVMLIVATGTGAAFAAEDTLPGNPLYSIKVRVTEPIRAALAVTPAARAEFETERAHRRLTEYAQLSVTDTSDTRLEEDLAESLMTHVSDAKEAITLLSESGEESDALAAASDLAAVLETHSAVIDLITETDVPADGQMEEALSAALDDAHELASTSEDALGDASQEEVADALDDAEEEAVSASETIFSDLDKVKETFDMADELEAAADLTEVRALIEAAKAAEESGDLSGALLLYTDANIKLSELSVLLEADAELGIDVIGETEN